MNQERLNILRDIEHMDNNKLMEVLRMNGLEDCCFVIEEQGINGFEFLNLIEVRIKLWKKLNKVQMARLWSAVQLANQNPEMFYSPQMKHRQIRQNQTHNLYTAEPKNIQKNFSYDQQNKFRTGNTTPGSSSYHQHPGSQDSNFKSINFSRAHIAEKPQMQEPFPNRPLPNPPMSRNVNLPLPPSSCNNNSTLPRPPASLCSPPTNSLPRPPLSKSPVPCTNYGNMDYKNLTQSEEDIYVYDDFFTDFTCEPWFREINRKRANDLLKNRPNGSFFVRPSSKEIHICIISLIYNRKMYNFPINKIGGTKLVVGNSTEPQFSCVKEIIDFYTQNGLPLNYQNSTVPVKLCHFN